MAKEFRSVISIGEAEKRISSAFKLSEKHEEVSLDKALGRVLADDIIASLDVPPFERSTMDGYALRARDTYGASEEDPKALNLKGRISAGEFSDISVATGTCVSIATGAPIPAGADSVVMVEYTETSGESILVNRPVAVGENIMKAGSDISNGEKVLGKGHRLTPRDTGVLAALGMTDIPVLARPKVAIISTGSELIEPGQELTPGKIYDVNSRALADAVVTSGGKPKFLGNARDVKTLTNLIQKSDHDMILTSGGTSVGEEDISYLALERLGKTLFHGIALKPGKPAMMGVMKGRPVVGLPGNPTSALVVFYVLVAPLLRRMAGLPSWEPKTLIAKLASRVHSSKGRLEYVPVNLKDGLAFPITKGSGAITTLSNAKGYVVVGETTEILDEGEEVDIIIFD